MHPVLRAVRDAIAGTPFERRVFLVGGAVRDKLLTGEDPTDFDLVTELDAAELAQLLFTRGVSEVPPVTYPRFRTAMVRVLGEDVELVTARRENYRDTSRKPETQLATLHEDALRRDFTVNTLLLDLATERIEDPLGQGRADLDAKVLRTPLDPAATFHEDPLRMLRVVRLRWRLGFVVAEGLEDAIRSSAERLAIVSFERIRDELLRMMVLPDADRCLDDLSRLGLMRFISPELETMHGVTQGDFHQKDVWDHTMAVVRGSPPDLDVRLAALLHDVGKPATRTLDEKGRVRFFGHEAAGESMARVVLGRWRLPAGQIKRVAALVGGHMRLCSSKVLSLSAARRILRDFGENWPKLLDLMEADANALKPGVRVLDLGAARAILVTVAATTPRESLQSPLSGQRIMEVLGVEPGPRVGEAKAWLAERVLCGDIGPGDAAAAEVALRAWSATAALAPDSAYPEE